MVPACVVRNLTPTSTPPLSGSASRSGVALLGQIVHGQALLAGAVVKLQLTGLMVLSARSLAPDTLTVYVVEAASAEFGVKVALRLVES